MKKFCDLFLFNKIYFDLLEELTKINSGLEDDLNTYDAIIKERLNKSYGYSKIAVDKARKYLINAGYVVNKSGRSIITVDGRQYLKDYHKYKLLTFAGKITYFVKNAFYGIISIISFVISIVALIVSICKK